MFVRTLSEPESTLADCQVQPGMVIFVKDSPQTAIIASGAGDGDMVEKYELSDDAYAQKKGAYIFW